MSPFEHNEQREIALIAARGLTIQYRSTGGAPAISDVSFEVLPGEVLGIVGESGSGKSTLGFTLAGLTTAEEAKVTGEFEFMGEGLANASPARLRSLRRADVGVVFQDAQSALNPVLKIGKQLSDSLSREGLSSRSLAQARMIELLGLVGIADPKRCLKMYPHELSGGMQQRVVIASAIARAPKLLIADEPTTALDVTVQAQIVDLLLRLRSELGMAILFISHDLSLVGQLADRIMVMRNGSVVEMGPADHILRSPDRDYTRKLMAAVPSLQYVSTGWLDRSRFWASN